MISEVWPRLAAAVAIASVAVLAQEEPPVFRSSVDLVTIPVKVLDADGRPVAGLGAKDFRARIDGEPRKIVSVDAVHHPDPTPSEGRFPLLSYSSNTTIGPAAVPRTLLLVFDVGGFDTTAARQAALEAEPFLEQLRAVDLVGIVSIPIATVAVDPTTEREPVRAALRRITGGIEPPSSRFKISHGEAVAMEQGDRTTAEEVIERECMEFFGPKHQCPGYVLRDAKVMARIAHESARRRFRSLAALVNALPGTADLKHVILLTPGFFHDAGAQALYHELGRDLAKRTAILSIVQFEGSEGTAESRLRASTPDWRLLSNELQLFAQATDADLLRLGNVTTRFQRLRRELDAYYLLTVSAERRDLDGKPHAINIVVNGVTSVVQYPNTMTLAGAHQQRGDATKQLASMMARPGIERGVPIGVQTTTVRGEDPKRLHVFVITRVPGLAKDAAIAIEVRDGERVIAAHTDRIDAATDAAGSASHVSRLAIPPGHYRLRVGIVEADGRAGSVDHSFSAALTSAGPLYMSELLVGQLNSGVLRPALDLSTTEPVAAMLELYKVDSNYRETPSVTFTISNVSDTSITRQARAALQDTEVQGIQSAVGSFDTTELPAGDYLLRAEVQAGGRRAVLARHAILHTAGPSAKAATPITSGSSANAKIPPVIERASAYVERYLSALSNVLMEEVYRQRQRLPGDMNTRTAPRVSMQTLKSEMLFVRLPPPAGPTAFRDVLTVDNRYVGGRTDRLQRLFVERHPSAVQQAQQIMLESARFNLGSAVRTLNVPTVPLLFLRRETMTRLRYNPNGEQELAGRRLTRIRFKEEQSPTLIRSPYGGDLFAEGEVWIEPATGEVWRATVSIEIPDFTRRTHTPDVQGDVTVAFRHHDDWAMLVPSSMTERYVLRNGEENTATAEYRNFRRFQVQTTEEMVR